MRVGELTPFLLVVDTTQISLDAAIGAIEESLPLENWYKFFSGSAVLVSRASLPELTEAVREALPDKRFLITVLERGKKNGWLPKPVWKMMNQPVPA